MDAAMLFWAIIALAYAIFEGCSRIANAIRYREVNVTFEKPIIVEHRGKEHGSPT